MGEPVRRRRAAGRARLPGPEAAGGGRQFTSGAGPDAGRRRLFHQARREPRPGRRHLPQPRLCAKPAPDRPRALGGPAQGPHRQGHRPARARRRAAGLAFAVRPRRLSAEVGAGALPALPDLPGMPAARARRWPKRAGSPGPFGAHRHRRPRPRRPAGLEPLRPGQPADLRRPRPLHGRPRLRDRADRRPAERRLPTPAPGSSAPSPARRRSRASPRARRRAAPTAPWSLAEPRTW